MSDGSVGQAATRRPSILGRAGGGGDGATADVGGCGCHATRGGDVPALAGAMVALLLLRARRRR
ncbi:MAG: hypothetical protein KF850_23760 [Labilithrix sp.]|nr:hypothetical protein [Labilithrix sp.]